jgi:hypothetical protein
MVLNPAVLGVTELNIEVVIFPKSVVCCNNELLYSVINNKINPPNNKIKVV